MSEAQSAEKGRVPAWRCEAHGVTTRGDCPRCDDELIALAEVSPANACRDCGHTHTPHGCTGDPTPSDLWAGVPVATCDCIPIEDLELDEYYDPDWQDPITRPTPPG